MSPSHVQMISTTLICTNEDGTGYIAISAFPGTARVTQPFCFSPRRRVLCSHFSFPEDGKYYAAIFISPSDGGLQSSVMLV